MYACAHVRTSRIRTHVGARMTHTRALRVRSRLFVYSGSIFFCQPKVTPKIISKNSLRERNERGRVSAMKLGNTFTVQSQPWGLFRRSGHRVLCSDGQIRACQMAQTADTFFSIPASIRIAGKSISGYVTTESEYDFTEKKEYCAYSFRQHTNQKNQHNLPPWPSSIDGPEKLALVKKAYSM